MTTVYNPFNARLGTVTYPELKNAVLGLNTINPALNAINNSPLSPLDALAQYGASIAENTIAGKTMPSNGLSILNNLGFNIPTVRPIQASAQLRASEEEEEEEEKEKESPKSTEPESSRNSSEEKDKETARLRKRNNLDVLTSLAQEQ